MAGRLAWRECNPLRVIRARWLSTLLSITPMSVSTLRYTAARPGGKVINELPLAFGQVG